MDNISRYFIRISKATKHIINKEGKPEGLGHGEMHTLHFISLNPGTTQQDISDRFGINKAATARQCASLEEKGLITRKDNEKDGRSKLLFATEKANEFHMEHRMLEERAFDELLSVLTDEERAEFARLLRKIADSLGDHKGGRQ